MLNHNSFKSFFTFSTLSAGRLAITGVPAKWLHSVCCANVLCSLCLLLLMQPTSTHTQQSQSIQELIAFEKARMEATRTANTAQLEQMLADDLVWVHSSGKRQTKAQYIADLNTKKTVYRSITLEETNARVYGDIAVTNGTASYKTTEQTVRAYHTCVYRKSSSGAWQVIAWQTTKVGK